MDITSLIAGVKNAASYLEEKGKTQAQMQLNVAVSALTDLNFENSQLKQEVDDLGKKLKQRKSYVEELGVVWRRTDKKRLQPYCPVAFSKDEIIPLQPNNGWSRRRESKWVCPDPDCEKMFNPWDYHHPHVHKPVKKNNLFSTTTRY